MNRKPATNRLAAPGIIPSQQAYALREAIKEVIAMHNLLAMRASSAGFPTPEIALHDVVPAPSPNL